jgi:hypothetical protein
MMVMSLSYEVPNGKFEILNKMQNWIAVTTECWRWVLAWRALEVGAEIEAVIRYIESVCAHPFVAEYFGQIPPATIGQ